MRYGRRTTVGEHPMRRSGCYPTARPMPTVNPDFLVWARKTAGLTLQDAVAKVGIKDERGVAKSPLRRM